ncbi:MAG: ybgC [Rhizobacter sp.]|nr:ybgC [Rhizobacter sp.]
MRIEIPDNKKFVYEMAFPIRWGDIDMMGHVNNVMYFRYLETVRIEWMRSIGRMTDASGEGFVIINAFCNFYTQLEYPNDVIARLYIANPGRTSFDKFVTLELANEPGKIYAAGGATTVWLDFPKKQPLPLPDWLRALFD